MNKRKGVKVYNITIAILWSVFGIVTPAFADLPVVSAGVDHGNWYWGVCGDSIDNNELPYAREWWLNINVTSPNVVTGPRFEFHSADTFTKLEPYPTLFTPPSTYIWDYPDRSLTGNNCLELINDGVGSPGFTAERSVDNPILLNDVTTQTMNFTLKFEEPFLPGINYVSVHLGTDQGGQDIVEESVLSQNSVPGWSNNGNGWWGINPDDVVIGTTYNFQVQIQCTKTPEYTGIAVFYKPQVSVSKGEYHSLPDVEGPNTVITHPEGETAYFQLNESVKWNRSDSLNRQDVFLSMVSVPIDDSTPDVNTIALRYGKNYDAAGTYLGHSFRIDIQDKNVTAAEVTTPAGRTWPLEVEQNWIGWNADLLTPDDLTALGIIEGTYNFTFKGLLGATITASVNLIFDTPTQIPRITYPSHCAENVKLPFSITWEPVQDISINNVTVQLGNNSEDREDFYTELPDQNSCFVPDETPYSEIDCDVSFDNAQTGQSTGGIKWTTYNYTQQKIHFTTGTFSSDFNGDGVVDFYDFAIIAKAWLSKAGELNWNPVCDISEPEDNTIDWSDLAVFVQNWLAGVEP
jgi:hypothetical protein